ncbi:NUDIX domain protein [Bacteriovorax sp. BSW11_IV]|uniref:NUDIX hydrolase n=1 Tax=Bacteriovorax sp. BSW11_IV TaxID=1353529 RepID=UPI00038A2649|nr:NUDIX domain-containing protein [Bacteriovorax sp. BSW11_IV]EQC45187.1 NUDIX domain protein [Bacteriovorax sp. BSW11_IV]
MITKNKVLAYIFRNNNGVKELLVFDHRDFKDVSPQVPAGTVDDGEPFEVAAVREVYEESGLKFERPTSFLGSFYYRREDINQIHKRHVYLFETDEVMDHWQHVVSDGDEDKGLVFNYYWLPAEVAREKLVGSMGEYLPK